MPERTQWLKLGTVPRLFSHGLGRQATDATASDRPFADTAISNLTFAELSVNVPKRDLQTDLPRRLNAADHGVSCDGRL